MSDVIIRVEKLSKKYQLTHQTQRHRYVALRDVIAEKAKGFFQSLTFAKSKSDSSQPSSLNSQPSSEDFWALRDVSFEVKRGEVVGIIGRNGAGKSTLLKILSRITEPTTGRVEIDGRVASLLEVGTGFHPELTGRENVFLNGAILGMSRAEIRRKFAEIVAFAEVEKFLDTPVKRYSSGMYVRLAFAVAAHLEPEILIVDEVLAVGDIQFQNKCLGKMQEVSNGGRTVLFVSHNMAAVRQLCTRGIVLVKSQLTASGNPSEIISSYLSSVLNSVFTSTGPIKEVKVSQDSEVIRIQARFGVSTPLTLPCFGFVVSDSFGSPIFGTNPRLSGVSQVKPARCKGSVEVSVVQPKLLDGDYSLSVWFGDGFTDFAEFRDCLRFTIKGMAGIRSHSANVVGPVATECSWDFTE